MPKTAKTPDNIAVTTPKQLAAIEAAWPKTFEAQASLRTQLEQAFDKVGLNDYFDWDDVSNWSGLRSLLGDQDFTMTVSAVAGVSLPGAGPTIYAMPTYGWDGGNAISTHTINLHTLATSSLFAGPGADLVVRTDPATLGIAVHLSEADSDILIQLF